MSESAQSKLVRGIVPPMVTPLCDDELDQVGLSRLLSRLLAGGVDALFILGTTGEGPSLSYRVRRTLIDAVTTAVAGRVPVLVGVTDTSLAESIDMARCAEAAGADAVVYAPPCYFPITQERLADGLRSLAQRSPLPVVLYNMPSLTKNVIEVETVAALLNEPNVTGIKDSSGDIEYFRRLLEVTRNRPDWLAMTGPEHLMAESVAMGGDGAVCGGANVHPALFSELFRAADAGDSAATAELQKQVELLGQLYQLSNEQGVCVIQGIKAALNELGVCGASLSSPYGQLPARFSAAVQEVLAKLDLKADTNQNTLHSSVSASAS